MYKKSRYRYLTFLAFFLFLFCAGDEQDNIEKLKLSDPLFYDTNNELVRLVSALKIGTSEEEFVKMFRIEDPSLLIQGRFGPVIKHVVASRRLEDSAKAEFNLGDVTAVPEFFIAKVTIKEGFVIDKALRMENMKAISRYRKAIKYYPSAKPVFYHPQGLPGDSIP